MLTVNHTNEPKHLSIANDLEVKALAINKNQQQIDRSSCILKSIRNFINPESNSLISLGKNCQSLLDKMEKVPVVFSSDQSKIQRQNQSYATSLKTAVSVVSLLSNSKSSKIRVPLENLVLRVAALQYRIEAVNGGLDRSSVDPLLTEKICASALEWKKSNSLIIKKELTPHEIIKLEKVSTYPEFAKILLESKSLKEAFFNWNLRDNNDVSLFVEFPATSARLKSAYLASRIGRLGVPAFQNRIEKKENGAEVVYKKNVTLPFYNGSRTDNISILNESREVTLNGGLSLTIGKIFNVFAFKNRNVGSLEIFKHGIMNWNVQQLGALNPKTGDYDKIDLSLDSWIKQLPILEEITKEQLDDRVGAKLETNEWVVFAKSSRTTPDFDLDGRHGFFEMAIPTGNGTYGIYPFGIFPPKFPYTVMELVAFLGNTFKAKLAYPDENFFYSHRQQAEHPIRLTDDEARDFMRTIQIEMIKSRYGHTIFQFGSENCAYWSQKTLNTIEAKKHNYYKTDYVESHPLNPVLKRIFAFFRSLPKGIRNSGIRNVDALFGTRRGVYVFENRRRVFKSHKTSPVRNEFVIYQPGYLHRQIEQGLIKGRISLGNC